MSVAAGIRSMGTPFFHELKKQASYFFKEKIKNARLALTDVTTAELLTEEATSGNPWAPDAKTMAFISRAAFEIDDYWRIVEILHKRLSKFDRNRWREPYQALILLEHLLTHGPESTAEEFQCEVEVIEEMGDFQYIDERGFNWGLTVRKKSERALKLLEKGPLLNEERDRARKVSRGIQGFGSFNQRWVSDKSGDIEQNSEQYRKWNSHYEADSEQGDTVEENMKESLKIDGIVIDERLEDEEEASLITGKPQEESKPLLANGEEERKIELQKREHPFSSTEHQGVESMLLLSQSWREENAAEN